MALGSTQPPTDFSTRSISWGIKAAGTQGRQPCQLNMAKFRNSGKLILLEPYGLFRPA